MVECELISGACDMMNFKLVPTVHSFDSEDLDPVQSARGDLLSPVLVSQNLGSIAYSRADELVTAFSESSSWLMRAALSFNSSHTETPSGSAF